MKTLAALRRDGFLVIFHLLDWFLNIFPPKKSQILFNTIFNYRRNQNRKISNSLALKNRQIFVTAWRDDFAHLSLITLLVRYYLNYLPQDAVLLLRGTWWCVLVSLKKLFKNVFNFLRNRLFPKNFKRYSVTPSNRKSLTITWMSFEMFHVLIYCHTVKK